MTANPRTLAAGISVASNTTLVIIKLVVGIITGSVSIISEAVHSALDLFAAIIAFFSVRESGRPADREHPYGHGKIENLSGAVEAMLILLAAMFIIHEAIDKLKYPQQVKNPVLGLYVIGISIVMNTLVSKHLFRIAGRTDSIALEADAHHLSTDVWTSIGVFIGLGLIRITGWHILDPLVAIAVALMIIRVAFSLTWKAAAPLLDTKLPDEEIGELGEIVMNTPGVRSYHKMRTRKAGPYRQVDFHLIVPAGMPVNEAHAIAERIEQDIRVRFPDAYVVTHIEPDDDDNNRSSPDSTDARPAIG
jgi:cation diffusion facilitator family transporter